MEKLMGKAEFAEKIGGYVTKPLGKPTPVSYTHLASFRTYASREEYRTGSSSLALKLDGIWKFAYAKNYTCLLYTSLTRNPFAAMNGKSLMRCSPRSKLPIRPIFLPI